MMKQYAQDNAFKDDVGIAIASQIPYQKKCPTPQFSSPKQRNGPSESLFRQPKKQCR